MVAVATFPRGRTAARPGGRVQLAQVRSAVKAPERGLAAALFETVIRVALTDAGQVLLPEAASAESRDRSSGPTGAVAG